MLCLALKVQDLEKATKFYENVFGFKTVSTDHSREHISRHKNTGSEILSKPGAGALKFRAPDGTLAEIVARGPLRGIETEAGFLTCCGGCKMN